MALAPEVQAHLDAGIPLSNESDMPTRRAELNIEIDRMFRLFGEPGPDCEVRTHVVDGADGRRLRALSYHPDRGAAAVGPSPRPVHLHLHGGGWTMGSIDNLVDDAWSRHRAVGSGCVVLALEYSLAPEHPFPAAVLDVIAAVGWVRAHAEELGIDPDAVTLGGASAGANIAAAAVVADHSLDVRALLLDVPVLDLTEDAPVPHIAEGPEAGVDAAAVQASILGALELYLEDLTQRTSPMVSPVLAPRPEALPPTWLFLAELDASRGGAERFAKVLRQAGVEVHVRCYEGALHGSGILTGTWSTARSWLEDGTTALRAVHGLPEQLLDRTALEATA